MPLRAAAAIVPATLVVAAPDSKNKTRADYVVSTGSTSAQTVINQAINALPAVGGKVVLLEGTYIVDGSIVLPSNVHLKLLKGATVKLKDGFDADIYIIKNADTTNGNTNIAVTGPGVIDGNKASQAVGVQHGICLTKVTGSKIVGLRVKDCKTQGIVVYNSANQNRIARNLAEGNDISGIAVDTCSGNVVIGNTCLNNGSFGISLYSATENSVTGNFCQGNAYGIRLSTGSLRNTVSGNVSKGNVYYGIYFYDSSDNTLTGNTAQGNG
ncbi:MAG: right-handed parallel beta-helix repeat-containing protein, partial [Pseudomonadota bacterium]